MTGYLLDANVFIQAKNLHYGFDFCPAFWDWLMQQNYAGRVASIEKVADELHAGGDELAEWARKRGDGFFLRPDDTVVGALTKIQSLIYFKTFATKRVRIEWSRIDIRHP